MLKIRLILGCIICLITTSAFAQESFTPTQIKQDLQFLKKRFEDMHPGMYYYTSPAEYDSVFQQLYNGVERKMTYQEAFRYIAPMISSVKDGHTSYKFKKNKYGKNPKLFPFYIQQFGTTTYISYNGTTDTTLVRGTELIALNDEPFEQVIQNLTTLYGTDNDNPSSKAYYAQRAFNIFYFKYNGSSDSLKLTYKLPLKDSLISKYVKCLPQSEIVKNLKKNYKNVLRSNFDYSVVDSTNKVAKLDITSFSMKGKFLDIGQVKFKKQLKKRFEVIKKEGVEHLIVDFRGNGGGFIPNIARLTKYFATEPFVLLDTTFFKRKAFRKVAPFYTIFPPVVTRMLYKPYDDTFFYRKPKKPITFQPITKNHFDQKVYFLIDGGSYSATTFTMALLKDMNIGTYIGQPPGGANWGSFASTWNDFKLPNTKIVVHMPLYKLLHNMPNQRVKTFLLTPDYNVNASFEDFLQRKDSVLEFTLDLIK